MNHHHQMLLTKMQKIASNKFVHPWMEPFTHSEVDMIIRTITDPNINPISIGYKNRFKLVLRGIVIGIQLCIKWENEYEEKEKAD